MEKPTFASPLRHKIKMKVKILQFDSYIATIKNSVGSKTFNSLWADVDGKREDILDDGRKSCGCFVSGILLWFGLAKERHATALGTVRDMKESGWHEIQEQKIGAVLQWEKMEGSGEINEHIGFYMGDKTAISTSKEERSPIEHHWTYGEENGKPKRKIIAIYWHPKLDTR